MERNARAQALALAGTRMDSLGWAIKNDTILVLKGLDLGIEIPCAGVPLSPKLALRALLEA